MAITNITPLGLPFNEVLGAGKIVANYGLSTQYNIGTTKGGCKFTDGMEFNRREGDGDYGYVKGAIDPTMMQPALEIAGHFRWDMQAYKLYAGMSSQTISGGKVNTYRTFDMSNAYSLTNIAWVGRAPSGEDTVYILKNPVSLSAMEIETEKDVRITKPIKWDATYDPATFDPEDDTTYPWYIETEASVITVTVTDGTDPLPNVVVTFNDGQQGTSAATTGLLDGLTVAKGEISYEAVLAGYTQPTNRVLTIDEDTEAVTIAMTAV